jgi:hypothetical protein
MRRSMCCALLGLGLSVVPPVPAVAHDWYPLECCTGRDCTRVDRVERMPDGTMRMFVGAIEVIVPKGFTQRPSMDNDAHVCVRRKSDGSYAPRCVFMPAGV